MMLRVLCATIALAIISGFAAAEPTRRIRRFAYLIGANDGGPDRVKLRYAGTDAVRLGKLLTDLGGVAARDVIVSQTSSRAVVARGFAAMQRRLAAARNAGTRLELIVYYSGHSDERGLLLGGERLTYRDLRRQIRELPADVHIAILDSCASGAFTRSKGGDRAPAFLADESSRVKGYAFITSSSADEVAQESDRIASSFFTHYLVSGLRGGADANRDGRVTLNEAYHFAFAETVARTENTVGGAQHPAYDMHLVGSGDVVITDLRSTSAAVLLAPELAGRLFFRTAGGQLVIELTKRAGHAVVLGLGPGTYVVTLERDTARMRASITLRRGARARLGPASFRDREPEATVARGGALEPDYEREPVRVSLIPPLSSGSSRRLTNVSINLVAGRTGALEGFEAGGAVNVVDGHVTGLEIAGVANVAGGRVRGVQIAGAANIASEVAGAIQIAGGANVARGSVAAGQVAGFGNYSGGSFSGVRIAGFGNYSGSARGVQIAGGANFSAGHVSGATIAGGANVAGSVDGLQLTGGANVAGSVDGLQLAGGVNVARRVHGLQLGVINVAGSVDGAQIGVINVADRGDAAIGLINVVRDGYRAAEVWTSDTGLVHGGLKLGARHTYSILAAAASRDRVMVGGGIGVHRELGTPYLDIDAIAYSVFDHDFDPAPNDLLAKLRASVGWRLDDRVAIFGGASMAFAFAFEGAGEDPSPLVIRTYESDSVVLRLSPGLFAGLNIQ